MKAKVTDQGLVIPKDLLEGQEEVEIHKEGDRIIVVLTPEEEDPILGLGTDPVDCGVSDAAERHDHYLYGPTS